MKSHGASWELSDVELVVSSASSYRSPDVGTQHSICTPGLEESSLTTWDNRQCRGFVPVGPGSGSRILRTHALIFRSHMHFVWGTLRTPLLPLYIYIKHLEHNRHHMYDLLAHPIHAFPHLSPFSSSDRPVEGRHILDSTVLYRYPNRFPTPNSRC